jgi:Ca2+-binding EF-hand superfamily protein
MTLSRSQLLPKFFGRNPADIGSTVPGAQRNPQPLDIMKTTNQRTAILVTCSFALCAVPAAFAGKDADKHFSMMDKDGDGKITRAEHQAGAKKMFTQCDANHDGIVTASEMDAFKSSQGEKLSQHEKSSAEKIKEIDQNGDGQLTLAEHDAGSEKMFGKMDKNGDGFLSKEECAEGMKMMKKDV